MKLGEPSSPWLLPRSAHRPGLFAANQQADHQADAGGDADRAPGILAHVIVGDLGAFLGFLARSVCLGIGERLFALDQALLDFLARDGDFFARLAGRGLE